MKFTTYLENKQKADVVKLIQLLREDQTLRADWDNQADDGWRIRNSELPLAEPIDNLKNYKGVYFKDNWVKKSFTWLNSYFTGADIYADVKSYDGIVEPNMELLENELNFSLSLSDMVIKASKAIFDKLYVGYGVLRTYFNTHRINNFWKTGTPVIEHIDARNVWFWTPDGDLDNIQRFWHAEAVRTEELKDQVAQYDKNLADTIKEDTGSDGYVKFPNTKGRTIVYTGIYKEVERVEKREFIYEEPDYETGEIKQHNWFEFEDEYKDSELKDKLPEGVYVAPDTIKIDKDCYYQVMFIPSQSILLKQQVDDEYKDVVYLGSELNYHIIGGSPQDGSAYPYGDAYDMKDILDLSVVFMSSLSKQIGNMNRPQPQIIENAVKNLNDFNNNHWKNNFILKLDDKWLDNHPNIKPQDVVTYKNTPINDRLFLVMQNYITEAIKSQSGAVDSARGEQQYSGQSGVLANQLQIASQTYLKADENKYRSFMDSILNWLMHTIVEYRQFPHKVKGLDELGQVTARDVNTTMINTLKDDDYFTEANLEPNAEQKKQIEKQQIMELLNAGKFPLKSALKVMDFSSVNIDRVMEELERERGIDRIAELLQEHPEISQMIEQYAQQLEQK